MTVFSPDLGKVTTDPNSAKIKDLLCGFLNDILEIVISAVHQLDAPEQRLSRPDTNKSILVPTIIVDSPSECLSVKPARSPLVHQVKSDTSTRNTFIIPF